MKVNAYFFNTIILFSIQKIKHSKLAIQLPVKCIYFIGKLIGTNFSSPDINRII